jgi:hypothetical protein
MILDAMMVGWVLLGALGSAIMLDDLKEDFPWGLGILFILGGPLNLLAALIASSF